MATVLITGANRGIGLEFCRQLRDRGDQVVAACRTSSPELDALGVRIEAGVDITDGGSIDSLRQRLDDQPIDLLINNAGLLERTTLEDLDVESLRRQYEVNAIGPLRLTASLLPLLHAGSRVVLITSRMGSIGDNGSGDSYGYRMSKVALCMAGRSLSIDLRPRGIAVAILHPGLVRTAMTGFSASGIPPGEAVRNLLARVDELSLENSGSFRHANGEELPW
jgi:NAD(P)-dependent dehydrogenase (short-subunit alcohol dehydrogenase family)